MTKHLLWEEYCQTYPDNCYSYSQFCDLYMQWSKRQRRSMRQLRIAAEKAFIDYAGMTIPIVNQHTGEILLEAQMFVAVLGASSFTYAEASPSQKLPDLLQSHVRMFEFFGGVVEMLVLATYEALSVTRVVMIHKPTRRANNWLHTTVWPPCLHALTNPKINQKPKWVCKSLSDGS